MDSVNTNPPTASSDVISLVEKREDMEQARLAELEREAQARAADKARRARRHGRRYFIPRMTPAEWSSEHHHNAQVNQIFFLAEHFRSRDFVVLWFLSEYQGPDRKITQAQIAKGTGIDPSGISRAIRQLVEAGMVVNIGTDKDANLAIQPRIDFWDLQRLRNRRTRIEP